MVIIGNVQNHHYRWVVVMENLVTWILTRKEGANSGLMLRLWYAIVPCGVILFRGGYYACDRLTVNSSAQMYRQ